MTLSREQTFELWAPAQSPWSMWAKPVLFSYLATAAIDPAWLASWAPPPEIASWAPNADGGTVLVLDLPGAQSVLLAEACARQGFRPVPLFNAVPAPLQLVEVHSIMEAIRRISERAEACLASLPPAAPAAFLLDANRRVGRAPRPGDFDNRSISLPTDFPSANFLRAHSVSRVLLVTVGALVANDLAHTLLRWQEAGLSICACSVDEHFSATPVEPITVSRPSRFGALWHNALSMLGLRRNPLGGFGGTLPVPSSG